MFSKEWEKAYKLNTNQSIWPWSEMISLVSRHTRGVRKGAKILELGCGTGANIPFFLKKKFDYYAIEGSKTAIKSINKRYPKLKKKIILDDFTKEIKFKKKFDIIIDRGSLTHNDYNSLKNFSAKLNKIVKTKGLLIINDWFSKRDSDRNKGYKIDNYTRDKIKKGRFNGIGKVNFADKKLFLDLFKKWKIVEMYERTFYYHFPKKNFRTATWSLVLKKK